jgi:sn-glycerol 3-phosphate transport system permease protein
MTVSANTTTQPVRLAWTYHTVRRHIVFPVMMHGIMLVGALLVLFPVVYACILSTQSPAEYYQVGNLWPGSAMRENYRDAWERAHLGPLLRNTLFVATTVAVGKIVLSISGAFALVYFKVRGRSAIIGLILLTHFLPLPVRIVPTYDLISRLGWVNTWQGLIVPFFASATGVLLFQQYFRTVSTDLADAARVDGAGPLRFLLAILLPISRTNIGALFLIEFIYMWNEYLWPLLMADSLSVRQVQIGIKQLIATDAVVEWGIVMAGTVTVILPPLIVLLALQRSLMSGLHAGEET